jgi:hypothetical protein
LNLEPFGSLEILVENSLKSVFFLIFWGNKGKIFYVPIPNERKRDFIVGHCIIFSFFFYLVIFYEPQT